MPRPARQVDRRAPDAAVPLACLAVFLVVWGALAVAPRYREDWLLENLPTFVAVPLAVWSYWRARLSDRSYVQATAFLLLHAIGSHYTYSEVPMGAWAQQALGLARNHYDRFVHLSFGVLMVRPALDLVARATRPERSGAALALSVLCVLAASAGYELIEWVVASVADPAAGTAFLGTQGDAWDAQKDMALALVGATAAALLEASLRRSRR